MKTPGIDKFAERLNEIFEQGNPTKAQIIDAFNKTLKEQQCHAIYEKVKEANTPDKRTFEEAEKKSGGKLNKTAKEYFMRKCNITELDDLYTLHYSELFQWMEDYASEFQEQPITDEMIRKHLLGKYPPFVIKDCEDVNMGFRDAAFDEIKWALSLKAQKAQPSDDLEKNGYSFETEV